MLLLKKTKRKKKGGGGERARVRGEGVIILRSGSRFSRKGQCSDLVGGAVVGRRRTSQRGGVGIFGAKKKEGGGKERQTGSIIDTKENTPLVRESRLKSWV